MRPPRGLRQAKRPDNSSGFPHGNAAEALLALRPKLTTIFAHSLTIAKKWIKELGNKRRFVRLSLRNVGNVGNGSAS